MAGNKRVTKTTPTAAREQKARTTEIGILGAVLTLAGIFIFLSLTSYDHHDRSFIMGDDNISNLMGAFGVWLAWSFLELFGVLSWAISAGIVFAGVRAVIRKPLRASPMRVIAPITGVISAAILIHMAVPKETFFEDFTYGGLLGARIGELLSVLIQRTGTVIVCGLALALSIMYMAGVTLRSVFRAIGRGTRKAASTTVERIRASARAGAERRRERRAAEDRDADDNGVSEIRPSQVKVLPETKNDRPGQLPPPEPADQDAPEEPPRQDEPAWMNRPDTRPDPAGNGQDDPRASGDVTRPDRTPAVPPPEPDDSDIDDVRDEDVVVQDDVAAMTGSGPRIILNKRGKASFAEDQMLPGMVRGPWEPPPLSLLDYVDPGQQEVDQDWLKKNAERLETKLLDYKVQGKVREIHPGPVVTMYEFLPAAGVKISQIANLADDLTMALEAVSIRIVAPIPGRGVVGIEVPNKVRETVYLREILASDEFTKSRSKLTIALGKDIFGNPVVTDLARMPHLLIAGATGSGKSVAVNAFILSLLRNASPEDVRIILVDPKVVELQVYEDIPHLLLPVVYDPKHAAAALRWAVEEMERRYSLLARVSARNIVTYNQRIEKIAGMKAGLTTMDGDDEIESGFAPDPSDFDDEDLVKLPYIVIVLDEFADLMMVASKDVETAVARLAQKARAAGIHLIMATQRPSKEVITGLIKANFPARMAFRVSSTIDSRIILDQRGGEALLGYGDMLFLKPGTSSLERVHGSFVSDDEVVRFVNHLKTQGTPDYQMEIIQCADDDEELDESEMDPLTAEGQAIVLESGRASISYLQRQLKIGYNRAARIMEILEKKGIVGPPDSRGERKILK